MPARVYQLEDSELLRHLEPSAQALQRQASKTEVRHARDQLQLVLEYALCDLMTTSRYTRGFWCDGVEFERVELAAQRVLCTGMAWCAAASQWRVPIQTVLTLSRADPPELLAVEIGLGDAYFENLAEHENARRPGALEASLESFYVTHGPADPRRDVGLVLAELHEWITSNPDGHIVDPNWDVLSPNAAQRFVREQIEQGSPIVLVPSWLDRRPALQIARGS